ncbi:HIT family protein, partial [Phocaeicola plebeius]
MEIICETATCVAFYDGYPVSPGHALIIPKRHVASYFVTILFSALTRMFPKPTF